MKLKDKVAIITGGASGIGRASALLFAKEGARVILADINQSGGDETVKEVRENGGEASFVKADVTKPDQARTIIQSTSDNYQSLNILFNNAGIEGKMAELTEQSEEDWDKVFDTNVKSMFILSKLALPVMIKSGGGVIINTASQFAHVGAASWGPYCASKSAILGLTRVMALECAKYSIRVNSLCPGAVATPLIFRSLTTSESIRAHELKHPMGRFGQPEEIARAALFLATQESSFMTGASLVVDGGYIAW